MADLRASVQPQDRLEILGVGGYEGSHSLCSERHALSHQSHCCKMDLGTTTKKTLLVIMWIVLTLGVIGGIVYCCYLGYEWTMEQRPVRDRERRPRATKVEPTARLDHGAVSETPRDGEGPQPKRGGRSVDHRRRARPRRRPARRRRESRSHSNDSRSSPYSDTSSRSRERGSRKRDKGKGKDRRPERVHVRIVRRSLADFPK